MFKNLFLRIFGGKPPTIVFLLVKEKEKPISPDESRLDADLQYPGYVGWSARMNIKFSDRKPVDG